MNPVEPGVVIKFINQFTDRGRRQEVINTFKYGCCYWFARILYDRFNDPTKPTEIKIVYTPDNHFGCKIGAYVYDVTGIVTNDYNWQDWPVKGDETLTKRLYRDCIYLLDKDQDEYVIE